MQTEEQVTATLEDWKWSSHYKGSLEGNVFNDTKRRFSDGTWIYTSTIVACDLIEGGFVKTLNSYYKLGKKFDAAIWKD